MENFGDLGDCLFVFAKTFLDRLGTSSNSFAIRLEFAWVMR